MSTTAVASPTVRPKSRRRHTPLPLPKRATAQSPANSKPAQMGLLGHGTWLDYLRLDKALEGTGHRVRFHKGQIEIMSISSQHEALKVAIAHLIAAYCLWAGMDFQGWGSATQRVEGSAGGEPDESFSFGAEPSEKPELILEIGLSSGGIDKLEFWREQGAKEVWVWEKDRLHGFARATDESFEPITHSRLLGQLDLGLVEEYAAMKPLSRALRSFRERLEAG